MKRAPQGLGSSGRRFWRSIVAVYELSPGELALLERACRCLDRLAKIDFLTANSQPMVKGSKDNLRPNPVYGQAIEHEKALETLIRSLALPLPNEGEGRIRHPDQQAKAQLRWRKFHEERDRARGPLAG